MAGQHSRASERAGAFASFERQARAGQRGSALRVDVHPDRNQLAFRSGTDVGSIGKAPHRAGPRSGKLEGRAGSAEAGDSAQLPVSEDQEVRPHQVGPGFWVLGFGFWDSKRTHTPPLLKPKTQNPKRKTQAFIQHLDGVCPDSGLRPSTPSHPPSNK